MQSKLTAACLALLLIGMIPWVPRAQAQADPTPPPTASADERPDRCEANDSAERPCVLPLDAVSGPFTFLPDGDQDYYSLDLGAEPGLALSIAVRGTDGLDLRTSVSRAGGELLATIASPAIATTLNPELSGWIVLRVENRSPQPAAGESYSIELRRELPVPPAAVPPGASAGPSPEPDHLEDNWSPERAAPIGVGVVYDLNFACPVPWGCAGGDHDYLAVPVKAGVAYLLATFDLGPGVDTVLDLFWGDPATPIATNDDLRPGASFLSALTWRAPSDGVAIVRVGPRAGGHTPSVFEETAGSYRFAALLTGSELARQLEARLAAQAAPPTPTAAPTKQAPPAPAGGASIPAAPPQPTPAADAPKGIAVVAAEQTTLRTEPGPGAPALQELPQGAELELLGQAIGAWVRAQPLDGVTPGWVYGPDLRRAAEGVAEEATTTEATPASATAAAAPSAPPPRLRVRALEPAPIPPPPTPAPRRRIDLTVEILAGPPGERDSRDLTTVIPAGQRPLAGVRVQLVDAFGDLLAEALTGPDGRVTLSRDLAPGAAAYVRVPALGAQAPVHEDQTTMRLDLPGGPRP